MKAGAYKQRWVTIHSSIREDIECAFLLTHPDRWWQFIEVPDHARLHVSHHISVVFDPGSPVATVYENQSSGYTKSRFQFALVFREKIAILMSI